VRHAINELLLRVVIGQAYRTASALQKPKRLHLPPEFTLQVPAESAAVALYLRDSLVVQFARTFSIRFFLLQLDSNIDIPEPVHFGPKIAAEQDHSPFTSLKVEGCISE
jgi:hypothetical protein